MAGLKLSSKQLEAVLALPGSERYEHFVKVVCDREEVWGLWQEGWALAGTNEHERVFPLWPAEDYASLCAQGEWAGYEPSTIPLEDLLDRLLPRITADGVQPAVFVTPGDKGVTPPAGQLEADLRNYLADHFGE